MKTVVDDSLRVEARRFLLLFRCDDCVHFDAQRAECVHGYPTDPHRKSLDDAFIVFCKEFDAGP